MKLFKIMFPINILILALVQSLVAQDIVFPGETGYPINPASKTVACAANMDRDKNGECECVSGYLYYLPQDRCYQAYHQGPCEKDEYLVLPLNTSQAECVSNPCGPGFAVFQGSCHELLKAGDPCPNNGTLVVDENTFQIRCQGGDVSLVTYQIALAREGHPCPPGSRLNALGMCRRPLMM